VTERTVGWIYPDVVDRVHQDFFAMTPPDVNLMIATRTWSLKMMHSSAFDKVGFDAHREEIVAAAAELGRYQNGVVDYVVVSGDLIQSAMGPKWDRDLSQAIAAAANRPATTAMTAVADALAALRVRRVAVVTPFRDDQNEHLRAYLEESGFEPTAVLGVHTNTTEDIRRLPVDCARRLAVRAVECDVTAEAVYISCPVWRGVSASVAPLERQLGRPVVTTFSAILWKALSSLSRAWHGADYGELLAGLGGKRAAVDLKLR
jgi:maleate isomerase